MSTATATATTTAPRAASVTLGYDVRTWTTYTVTDATPEELATLSQEDSPEALALLRQMDAAERLTEEGTFSDDAADPFADHAHPAVIDFEETHA